MGGSRSPDSIAEEYRREAHWDNLDDKFMTKNEQSFQHEKFLAPDKPNTQGNDDLNNDGPQDANNGNNNPQIIDGGWRPNEAFNDLASREINRHLKYQDAAEKNINNMLSGFDQELEILEKHDPRDKTPEASEIEKPTPEDGNSNNGNV